MDDSTGRDEMTRIAMDTRSLHELAEIETDTRFFMRLLISAGIAAAAVVGAGVVWHESELAGGIAPVTQVQIQPIGLQ
jgi:hypothetical protein